MRAGFITTFNGILMLSWLVVGASQDALGQAASGASGKGDPYRVAHQFADAGEAGAFLELLSRKEVIAVQLEVVSQLTAEKKAELESFNCQLEEVYDLDPDLDYSFDAESGRVFEAGQDDDEALASDRLVPALILKEGPRKERFTKLALARNATKQQILAFNLVQSEKTMEMQQTDRALEAAYGVTTNGTFRYAAETLTLYERVEAP